MRVLRCAKAAVWSFSLFSLSAVYASAQAQGRATIPPSRATKPASSGEVALRWAGHSCFLITAKSGLRILTDPYGPQAGYSPLRETADIVTISHEHGDHNAVRQVQGRFEIVRGPGQKKIKGITIRGIRTSHGSTPGGQPLGENTVFVIQVDGLRICHLGDLGTLLSPQQVQQIGRVDVLLIPVGGYYTIDGKEAGKVIAQLNPRIVVPMHYKTRACRIQELAGLGPFLQGRQNVRRGEGSLSLTPQSLPKETPIYILPYG